MRYRPEVEGLRAIAVVPVILFHANTSFFSGGYVGVDVFFVISGFLITLTLLADENFPPRERIIRFYVRRIRRILPVLVLVVLATLVVGAILLLPDDLIRLAKSTVATALFVSNFWFWTQSGYFLRHAEFLPLLHTWSLAIEEQFYIIFPLTLIVIGKNRHYLSVVIMSFLAATLFISSVYLTKHYPGAAFYWPTRAWELLLGAVLALAIPKDEKSTNWLIRELVAAGGIALIGVSVFAFDRITPFPGYAALVPVVGTAAVIYGGSGTRVGRVLSLRPFIWVGMISYSLYLWHWPILVFAKQALATEQLDLSQTIVCIALSSLASALSWRFVETPFRRRATPRRSLFLWPGWFVGGSLVLASTIIALHGIPRRFSAEALSFAQTRLDMDPSDCAKTGRFLCQVGDGKARLLVWGDSHAGTLWPAISNLVRGPTDYAIASACPPLLSLVGSEELRGDVLRNCEVRNRAVMNRVIADQDIDVVVLAAFWSSYTFSKSNLRKVLDGLKSKMVYIIGDNPTPGFDVSWKLALGGAPPPIHPNRLPAVFKIIDQYPNVKVLNLSDALCSGDLCAPAIGSHALYVDGHHISDYAANTIITRYLKDKLPEDILATASVTR